jgi:calcium-dependent protein kinase
MAYCHENKVVHRDLKPENILLDTITKNARGDIKVIDFGTANVFSNKKGENNFMDKEVGTAYYIAPEVINLHYTEKCDVWSIGVILYIMIGGRPPFDAANEQDILKKVLTGEYKLDTKEFAAASDGVKDLISKMMEVDYKKRLSAKEALEHPWIKEKVKTSFNSKAGEAAMINLRSFTVSNSFKYNNYFVGQCKT